MQRSHTAAIELYWIPLGDLYHAALVVELAGDRYTIDLAPSPNADEASRGVVATGAVGSRRAGRCRVLRYLPTDDLRAPPRGRAPGWDAGLEVARRSAPHDRGHAEALQLTLSGG